ncbi:hypothetical protein HYW32_03835 [Candidatus Berkelbacteria bacterium]|nr:hypothetical protein [Candidatus Berkelbacteria bacterium]
MKSWKLVILTLVLLTLSASAVYAIASEWHSMESDLIRCADTKSGNDCGSNAVKKGTDPLQEGQVSVTEDEIDVHLEGASAEKTYKLFFISLKNTGANPDGNNIYNGTKVSIGNFSTNESGNANAEFSKKASAAPRLGYFLIESVGDNKRQFATGIDQM